MVKINRKDKRKKISQLNEEQTRPETRPETRQDIGRHKQVPIRDARWDAMHGSIKSRMTMQVQVRVKLLEFELAKGCTVEIYIIYAELRPLAGGMGMVRPVHPGLHRITTRDSYVVPRRPLHWSSWSIFLGLGSWGLRNPGWSRWPMVASDKRTG